MNSGACNVDMQAPESGYLDTERKQEYGLTEIVVSAAVLPSV